MRYYLGYLCNGWCGHICEYVASYDCFVPECGCPIHDPEEWWMRPVRAVVLWIRPLPVGWEQNT